MKELPLFWLFTRRCQNEGRFFPRLADSVNQGHEAFVIHVECFPCVDPAAELMPLKSAVRYILYKNKCIIISYVGTQNAIAFIKNEKIPVQ